jgi:hypothetical protein
VTTEAIDMSEAAPAGTVEMAAGSQQADCRLLAIALGVLTLSIALGAAIGASRIGLYVPDASSGSLPDAGGILANNAQVCALLVGAALLQPRGIPGLAPGFLPLWLTDLAVSFVVLLNLIVIGGVIGALGLPALVRIAPHAPLELGAYVLVVVAYLRARRGELDRRGALLRFAIAALLLLPGAGVESYVSGGLG